MDRRKSGRLRSAEKTAPREIEGSTAAPNQDEAQLEPAHVDVTATGGNLSNGAEGDRNVVGDTGWYVDRGMNVRVVVLGGAPDPRRWSWLQRTLQRG